MRYVWEQTYPASGRSTGLRLGPEFPTKRAAWEYADDPRRRDLLPWAMGQTVLIDLGGKPCPRCQGLPDSAGWCSDCGDWIGYGEELPLPAEQALGELLIVASGALGYLEALPVDWRPDESWFKPLREALARAKTVQGSPVEQLLPDVLTVLGNLLAWVESEIEDCYEDPAELAEVRAAREILARGKAVQP